MKYQYLSILRSCLAPNCLGTKPVEKKRNVLSHKDRIENGDNGDDFQPIEAVKAEHPVPQKIRRHVPDKDHREPGLPKAALADALLIGIPEKPGQAHERDRKIQQLDHIELPHQEPAEQKPHNQDRKSTRLNSSHSSISYAVFCLKK